MAALSFQASASYMLPIDKMVGMRLRAFESNGPTTT